MIPEISFNGSTSILRFQSVPDLRRYLKKIVDGNTREMDKLNDAVALAMRTRGTIRNNLASRDG